MNLVVIKGNLTRDPELRYLPAGTAVCDFGIAVNRTWKDDQGQKKEEVSFFDVQAWAGRAETVAKWFTKGKPILVTGRLKQETWEDKQTGQNRSKVKIVLDSFDFCGDTKGGGQGSSRAEAPQPDADYTPGHPDNPMGRNFSPTPSGYAPGQALVPAAENDYIPF